MRTDAPKLWPMAREMEHRISKAWAWFATKRAEENKAAVDRGTNTKGSSATRVTLGIKVIEDRDATEKDAEEKKAAAREARASGNAARISKARQEEANAIKRHTAAKDRASVFTANSGRTGSKLSYFKGTGEIVKQVAKEVGLSDRTLERLRNKMGGAVLNA